MQTSWLASALKGLWGRMAPDERGTVRIPGLKQPVEILTDAYGVPHIYADNLDDLYFAQGYTIGRERGFQLDLMRRMASGRLSEVFGSATLPADRFFRVLGLPRMARATYLDQTSEAQQALECYTRGVNLAFERFRPVELRLLGYRPEPWEVLDGLLFSKLMAFDMGQNWENELARGRLLQRVGPEGAAAFHYEAPPEGPAVLGGDVTQLLFEQLHERMEQAAAFVDFGVGRWSGSNAWAVSGQHTQSGRPLLASDPHLLIRLPSAWFEIHLHCPQREVYGGALPGIPGIIIGQNRQLAWGMTNSYVDCQDLVVEQLSGDEVRTPDGWRPLQLRTEVIRIKGKKPHSEIVRESSNGPLLHRVAERGLALRWTGWHGPDASLTAMMGLGAASSVEEARRCLKGMRAPALNLVLADTAGNIGYQLAGAVPIRERGTGLVPVPGWEPGWGWKGEIPYEEMPALANPASGIVVSANHAIADKDYPYPLSHDFVGYFRAQRIAQALSTMRGLTAEGCACLQCDLQCSVGLRFAQAVAKRLDPASFEGLERQALEGLTQWDGWAGPESQGACIYEVMLLHTCRIAFEARLGKEGLAEWMGMSQAPNVMMAPQGGRYTGFVVEALERDAIEMVEGGDWTRCLKLALEATVTELKSRLGPSLASWSWGKLHAFRLEHPLGRAPALSEFFNGPELALGGDTDTIFQTAVVPHDPYRVQCWAPSWRFVADLADPSRSSSVLPSGQSGWPGSPHYLDQLPLWFAGKLHPCLMGRSDLESSRPERLVLAP